MQIGRHANVVGAVDILNVIGINGHIDAHLYLWLQLLLLNGGVLLQLGQWNWNRRRHGTHVAGQ